MAAIPVTNALLHSQAAFLRDYAALALQLVAQIGQLLTQNANRDGMIPLNRLQAVQNQAQDLTLRLYVDPQQGPYSADGVTPVAEYPRVLNRHLIAATVGVVAGHSRWLQQRPDDLQSWLRLGSSRSVPTYDPFHKWVDPRGWDLSQRIWEVGLNTRRKIGEYLDQHIRQGASALRMSRQLEQFLVPGRRNFTTKAPYGTTASFDGMRLARTEIAMAHTNASFAAALANPFVSGMDWKLSARHPKFDVCDGLATIGMSGERLKDPYPVDNAPRVVADSHPQCICCNAPATEDMEAVLEQIRADMANGNAPDWMLPIDVQAFVIALLGAELSAQILQAVAAQ